MLRKNAAFSLFSFWPGDGPMWIVLIPCSHTLFANPVLQDPVFSRTRARPHLMQVYLCIASYSFLFISILAYSCVFLCYSSFARQVPPVAETQPAIQAKPSYAYYLSFLCIPLYRCVFLHVSLYFFVFVCFHLDSFVFLRISLLSLRIPAFFRTRGSIVLIPNLFLSCSHTFLLYVRMPFRYQSQPVKQNPSVHILYTFPLRSFVFLYIPSFSFVFL